MSTGAQHAIEMEESRADSAREQAREEWQRLFPNSEVRVTTLRCPCCGWAWDGVTLDGAPEDCPRCGGDG